MKFTDRTGELEVLQKRPNIITIIFVTKFFVILKKEIL